MKKVSKKQMDLWLSLWNGQVLKEFFGHSKLPRFLWPRTIVIHNSLDNSWAMALRQDGKNYYEVIL
jgi:hypothetical protein